MPPRTITCQEVVDSPEGSGAVYVAGEVLVDEGYEPQGGDLAKAEEAVLGQYAEIALKACQGTSSPNGWGTPETSAYEVLRHWIDVAN